MKKYTLVFVLLTFSFNFSFSQVPDPVADTNIDSLIGVIYTKAEQMPEFPYGGLEGLTNFLGKNIQYPQAAKKKGISGTVFVTFVVDSIGNIRNAKLLRGIGGGCDEESLRVVNLFPQWIPGKINGKTVNVQYNLPIRYTSR